MRAHTHRTVTPYLGLVRLVAAGACLTLAAQPALCLELRSAPSGDAEVAFSSNRAQQPTENPASVTGGASGMMIYIDPRTGALLREAAPGSVPLQLTPQLRNAFSTSHQGLAEVPIAAPGVGVKVDLQGRFQSPLIATTDASGNLKIQHLGEMSGADDTR